MYLIGVWLEFLLVFIYKCLISCSNFVLIILNILYFRVYLSPPKSTGFGDPFAAADVSGLPLLSHPELETKSCVTLEATPTPPKPVLQAFKLLSGSTEVQVMIASLPDTAPSSQISCARFN
jgi:hypothetical protein